MTKCFIYHFVTFFESKLIEFISILSSYSQFVNSFCIKIPNLSINLFFTICSTLWMN